MLVAADGVQLRDLSSQVEERALRRGRHARGKPRRVGHGPEALRPVRAGGGLRVALSGIGAHRDANAVLLPVHLAVRVGL